jgi:glutamyl-tRNA synthetase
MVIYKMKTRIAPTPSGFLHVGNAVSFLITYCLAKSENGKLLLRIDDLDRERYRKEYVEDIFYALDWLGIQYDEGPSSVADFDKYWSQHQRLSLYDDALKSFLEQEWVYACDCTRKDLVASGNYPVYDGKCRDLKKSFLKNMAWRWRIKENTSIHWIDLIQADTTVNLSKQMGDFVVKQKNGLPSYQLGSYVDDLHFNITHIIRGADLLTSTAAQLCMATHWQSTAFQHIYFGHHPLITDKNGNKLSKSAGSESLKSLREPGKTPLTIIEIVRKMLGLPDEKIKTTEELLFLCFAYKPFMNEKIRSI